MKSVVTIGTPLLTRTLARSHDYDVVCSINNISPRTLMSNCCLKIDDTNDESAALNDLLSEINNRALRTFCENDEIQADIVIIDLTLFRLCSVNYSCGSNQYTFTARSKYNPYLDYIKKTIIESNNSETISEYFEDPNDLSINQLSKYINDFIKYLHKIFPDAKLLLMDFKFSSEYLSKSNKIEPVPNFNESCIFNKFRLNVLNAIGKKIKYIPSPDIVLYEEKYGSVDLYSITPALSNYYLNCIDGKSEEDSVNLYNKTMMLNLRNYMIVPIIDRTEKQLLNRKIIVLGSEYMKEVIESISNLKIESVINYNKNTTIEYLHTELNKYFDKYSKYYFIIPILHSGVNVEEELSLLHFTRNKDYVTPIRKSKTIENFTGYYSDIYNNKIMTEYPLTIDVLGSGSFLKWCRTTCKPRVHIRLQSLVNIDVQEDVINAGLTITTYSGSSLIIGKGTTFADECHIRLSFFGRITIGQDCMFSSQVVLFCGDGHAIYDLETGSNINYYNNDKKEIIISDHVWVGYQAFLLSKTDVGTGSIIGARSLTNKKYPKNVIIAGSPAKVVKSNVTWDRDPLEYHLSRTTIKTR